MSYEGEWSDAAGYLALPLLLCTFPLFTGISWTYALSYSGAHVLFGVVRRLRGKPWWREPKARHRPARDEEIGLTRSQPPEELPPLR